MITMKRMVVFATVTAIIGCSAGKTTRLRPPMPQLKARVMAKAKPESEKHPTRKSRPGVSQANTTAAKRAEEEICDAECQKEWKRFHDFTISVYQGNLKEVRRMLSKRLISLKGSNGMEALSNANHPRILRLLIKNGVAVNSRNSDGETALMMAAFNRNYQKVRDLIRYGADVKLKNTKADTSAISYCTSGKIARLLIAKGADVNEKNIYGTTPLIYASSRERVDVVKVLLKNGAYVNVNSPVVGTALMMASSLGNVELVKLLISKGADLNTKGTDYFDRKKAKKTALQLAKENNQREVVKILKKHGAVR
jgi:ankyrin repeat protein